MEPTKTDNSIARKVLAAIESGKVHMRPKWHFVLKAALAIVGLIFLTGALVYLVSFIIFAMRESGAWYLTPFGLRGLKAFLMAAPWILIVIAAAVFIILEVLVRRYSFAYRRPLLYSIVAVMALITLSSFAVARTPLHPGMIRRAEERRLPFGGDFYRNYGAKNLQDVHPGFVIRLENDGFDLESPRTGVIGVRVTPQTRFIPDKRISVGDHVIVFGSMIDGRIQAFGVRETPPMRAIRAMPR